MGWMPRKQGMLNKATANERVTVKPLARSENLVIEELGDELLIYDLNANRAHSLGASAARVWRACDGNTTVEVLSARTDLDAGTVAQALEELRNSSLLDGEA